MTTNNLTEQWKKGELERGWYYVLLFSNEEYITFIDGKWVVDDRLIGADIKEVLAEVPDYLIWKNYVSCYCDEHEYNLKLQEENERLKKWVEEFNALNVAEENQKLKELLRECNLLLIKQQANDEVEHKESAELVLRIEEVLK